MFAQLEANLSTSSEKKKFGVVLPERRLRPAFLLLGEVVAWRCSLCQRVFAIWDDGDLRSITGAFERHSCALTLAREFQWSSS